VIRTAAWALVTLLWVMAAIAGPVDNLVVRAKNMAAGGNAEGAVAVIDSALAVSPTEFKLLLARADILAGQGDYQTAYDYYIRALAQSGKDPNALYGAGMAALKKGNFAEAQELFQKGVNSGKRKAEFLYGLGLAQMELGSLAEADLTMRKAIKADGKVAAYHDALGDINFRKGVWTFAISEYKTALELDSTLTSAYLKIGESFFQSADLTEAVRNFKEYVRRAPADTFSLYRLARIFEASKNPAEAAFFYQKLTEQRPNNGEYWFGYGRAEYELGKYDQAGEALEKAIALGTKVAESYGMLAKIYHQNKQYYKADSAYTRYEAAFGLPNDPEYWIDKGKVMFKIAESDPAFIARAIDAFDTAIKLDSNNIAAYEYAGIARYYKQDYKGAIPFMKRKVELAGADVNVNTLRNLAICYLKTEQYDIAAATLESALKLKPDDAVMRQMLGNIYKFRLQCDKAVEHYRAALKDTTGAISAQDRCKIKGNLGFCYVVLRECQNAVPLLESAVECEPRNEEYLMSMAQAYHLCNEIKKANAFYTKVLDLNPKNKAAQEGKLRTEIR